MNSVLENLSFIIYFFIPLILMYYVNPNLPFKIQLFIFYISISILIIELLIRLKTKYLLELLILGGIYFCIRLFLNIYKKMKSNIKDKIYNICKKSVNNKLNIEKAIYKICDENINHKYNYYDLYYSNYYIRYKDFEDEFKKKLEKKFSNETEYLDYILKLVDIKIKNRDVSLSTNMSYISIIVSVIAIIFTLIYNENINNLENINNIKAIFMILVIFLLFFLITEYLKSDVKHILKLKNFKRYLENEIENINKIEENEK